MSAPAEFLNASEAARRLGVSVKALRLYEQRGLVTPIRSAAGWRAYGPNEMGRAAEIAALRGLGFSLAQVAVCCRAIAKGSSRPLRRIRRYSRAGSARLSLWSRRSGACGATWRGAKRRVP